MIKIIIAKKLKLLNTFFLSIFTRILFQCGLGGWVGEWEDFRLQRCVPQVFAEGWEGDWKG